MVDGHALALTCRAASRKRLFWSSAAPSQAPPHAIMTTSPFHKEMRLSRTPRWHPPNYRLQIIFTQQNIEVEHRASSWLLHCCAFEGDSGGFFFVHFQSCLITESVETKVGWLFSLAKPCASERAFPDAATWWWLHQLSKQSRAESLTKEFSRELKQNCSVTRMRPATAATRQAQPAVERSDDSPTTNQRIGACVALHLFVRLQLPYSSHNQHRGAKKFGMFWSSSRLHNKNFCQHS